MATGVPVAPSVGGQLERREAIWEVATVAHGSVLDTSYMSPFVERQERCCEVWRLPSLWERVVVVEYCKKAADC